MTCVGGGSSGRVLPAHSRSDPGRNGIPMLALYGKPNMSTRPDAAGLRPVA